MRHKIICQLSQLPILSNGVSKGILKSPNYPDLRIGYHDTVEVSGSYIRNLLMKEVGLSEKMAREIIK